MSGIAPYPMLPPLGKQFVGWVPRWHIQYNKFVPATVKETPRFAKAANLAAIQYWHDTILPKHFLIPAKTEYKYQPRAKVTELKKAKRYGHRKPIVMKGLAEAMLEGSPVRLSSTSKAATMTLRGPFYLGFRRKKEIGTGLSPDLKAEVAAMSQEDAELLAKVARKSFIDAFKRDRTGAHTVMITKP